jgi:hypothetical protein
MAIRKTSLEKRVAARKRNAFEGIPNSAAKRIQKRNKAIADEGLEHLRQMSTLTNSTKPKQSKTT